MTLDEMIEKIDLKSFYEKKGVVIKKERNSECEGSCPLCNDQKHFNFNTKNGLWKCWRCQESGNVVSFLKKLNYSSKEIRELLQGEAGITTDLRVVAGAAGKGQKKTPNSTEQIKTLFNSTVNRIYKRVVELLPLTDIHRQQLKVKRGFSDETIDRLMFRSLGQHAAALKERLLEEFDAEDLAESRVLISANSQLMLNNQLLEDRVLIPYLGLARYTPPIDGVGASTAPGMPAGADSKNTTGATIDALLRAGTSTTDETGACTAPGPPIGAASKNSGDEKEVDVYYIRPHKLGFEKLSPQIYCRLLLQEARPAEHVVLTEGEFKAAALWQWGIPAAAVPGISSFGLKHLDRLVALFKEFGVKKVTVIFDNEIKDNPEYSNYKPKASDRYDTHLWSYLMAYKLGKAGLDTSVGWLPDSWREQGKIDFDGALAQGRTRQDILDVIARAKTPREFLEGLPEEPRRIVQRKISMHFTRLNIRRDFNRYVVTRYRGTDTYDEIISNFVINIKSSFFTPDGVVRNVQLVNEYGETSEVFPLDPGEMAGLNEFKKFCFGKGNYIFSGKGDDLIDIWKLEFARDSGELIYMPDRICQLAAGQWIFGNLAVRKGETYWPDNDGIIWIKGKGYKAQSLQLGPRGESTENSIPALSVKAIDIAQVARRLKQTIGGYEAYMAMGWVIASIFNKKIFEEYRCLPILFAHGKRESGKTTFMHWIMSFFGVDTEGIGLAETSQNFITRALAYYSGMGVWFDEYRNEPKIIQKDGFFRSAYNRQLSGKGTPTAFQAKGFAVNACVAISGEEYPKDNGLFTRCIPLQISEYKRDRTHFEWLNRHSCDFSGFIYQLLINYEQCEGKIMSTISSLKKALSSNDISDRTATNWAICAGAFDAVILQDDEFIRWVEKACQEMKRAGEQEHMLNQFWNDVSYLVAEKDIDGKFIRATLDGHLYVWMHAVYEKWAVHYRKKTGREPFDKASIQKYLKDEPYCVSSRDSQRIRGSLRSVWVFCQDKAPDALIEIAEMLGDAELRGC